MSEKFNSNSFENHISENKIDDLLKNAEIDGIQKIVAGAVIEKDQKLLLVKRAADDFMGGLVELPSGSVDPGETIIEGLIREVKEETGLDIAIVSDFIDTFDYVSGSGKKARQFNFLVKVSDGNVVLNPEEHENYEWKSVEDDLTVMNISDKTQKTISEAINKIISS